MPWQIDTSGRWLYIASDEGLVEYDGLFPSLFSLHNQRTVRSVTVDDKDGKILVGGINEFGYFMPSPESSLEYVCLSDSIGDDRNIGNIWGIYRLNDSIIAQGDNAIVTYNLLTGHHSLISSEHKLDVSSFVNDALLLGTTDGLKVVFGNHLENVPGTEELKSKRIRDIFPYHEGILVVTTDGVWKYETQRLTRLESTEKATAQLGEIFSADLKGDTLALGSVENGVAIIDLTTGLYDIYDELNGLSSNTIISLKYDHTGNLWVGMQYGIGKIMFDLPVGKIDNSALPIGSGYVLALRGENLYLGTNRGLFRTDYDKEKQRINENYEAIPELRGQVWGITDLDGVLLVSLDQGLFALPQNGQPERIGRFIGAWNVVRKLGNTNKAYASSYSGLHQLIKKDGKWVYDSQLDGYAMSMYNFVQESPTVIWNNKDQDGFERITIDTLNNRVEKIEEFTQTQDGFPLLSDVFVSRIDNNIYFSTENGIYIYDSKTNSIIRERELSRLLGEPKEVKRLKKTNGGLFALTKNSIIEADPAGILGIKRFALPPSMARPMHDGDLFYPVGFDFIGYPVRDGYLILDFTEKSNPLWKIRTPMVKIKDMRVISNGDSLVYSANFMDLRNEPYLNHNENSVRINFGNVEDAESGILYSTRLNNEPWSTPSTVLSREYTDLHPGKYRMEVKAISPDGKESSDTLVFRVGPPWWRNNWMLIIYSVIFAFIILMLIRLEMLRVNRKESRLLNQKNEELETQKRSHQKETEEKDRQIEQLEREKLDKELKHKAQEVANVMMSLSHKNDTLQTVKRELQNITAMVPRSHSEVRKAISDLQDKVEVDLKSDDVLKRVEEEFDIVHDNFIKKLRTAYPDLTNNEVLLCAYLKMNLTTKEIAPLLNISTRGVETMRYRLRKKFSLDRENSLTVFIANFK